MTKQADEPEVPGEKTRMLSVRTGTGMLQAL